MHNDDNNYDDNGDGYDDDDEDDHDDHDAGCGGDYHCNRNNIDDDDDENGIHSKWIRSPKDPLLYKQGSESQRMHISAANSGILCKTFSPDRT